MKASYSWLRSLLPGLTLSPAETADRLTALGLEVEGIEEFGPGLSPMLVVAVTEIEPHPTKSGLRLVTVDRGGATQKVVCGAPNVPPPGGLVVLAPLGAHLRAKGVTIEPRTIAGVVSEGMLCSESELGIGAGGDGILVLETGSAAAGQRFIDAVPSAHDVIYEINLTANRPDALGHLGIARDLSARLGIPLVRPAGAITPPGKSTAASLIRVEIDDAERCPHYGASVIEGVKIGPSPLWVQHRLTSLGVRPVSNVVDVTNLLLLELGHPMHAFDLDKVRGGVIRVRRARDGEALETLDGKKRTLVADDLVIADGEGATGLAGVMGGAISEIDPATTRVLLECAYFEPRGVRRTSRRQGLHTDASHRFERGVDRDGVEASLARATALVAELGGGAPAQGAVHTIAQAYVPLTVTLRASRLDSLLGVHVPFDDALAILGRLGCVTTTRDLSSATLTVPSWRPDITRETDLIEEVARLRGYDTIPITLPPIVPTATRSAVLVEQRLRQSAVELGLSEALTFAFVSARELDALSAAKPSVRLENPLTEERSVLRTSILTGLLESVGRARRNGERSLRYFAMGSSFFPAKAGDSLPLEKRQLGVILAGPRPGYLSKEEDHDALDAKGIALELVQRVTHREARIESFVASDRPPHLHPRAAARLLVGEIVVGQLGAIHPRVSTALDLGGTAIVIELDIASLTALGEHVPQIRPIPRVPAIMRDVALVVNDDVAAGEVSRMIRDAGGELCEEVELFDLFRGGAIPESHRSLAFHVVYRDPKAKSGTDGARTLTDAEVDQRHQAVVAAVREKLGAVLRA